MGSFNFGDTMKDAFSTAGDFFTLGLTGAIKQKMEGVDMADQALEDIENFERTELTNAFKNLEVSERGANIRREESARATASGIKALQGAGARGVVGGVSGIVSQANRTAEDIAAMLDEKQEKLDFYTASDEVRIQNREGQIDDMELEGLGKMWETGMSMEESGTQQIGEFGGKMINMAMSGGTGGLPMGGGATGVKGNASSMSGAFSDYANKSPLSTGGSISDYTNYLNK